MITSNLNTDSEGYKLRLVMYTHAEDPQACLDELSDCNGTHKVKEQELCACLQEESIAQESIADTSGSTGTLNWVDSLTAFADELCKTDRTLTFRGEQMSDSASPEWTEGGEQILEIDLTPPPKPESPIKVRAGENALVISLATSDRGATDVATHEVCVQRSTSTLSDAATAESTATASNLDDLRRGFSASSCKQTDKLKSEDYRYEGLENDVLYAVVVASLDAAGNRSENSAIFEATPASLLDFAEVYSHRLGGAEGESGGCSTTSAEGHSVLFGLLLLCFIGLRRERT
jgi:MYXO-CTERM domain-containing protein